MVVPASCLRLWRGAEHLHRLGPRAIAEFLNATTSSEEYARILDRLDEYRARLTPEMMELAGCTGFPCLLLPVPDELCEPKVLSTSTTKPELHLVVGTTSKTPHGGVF
jgi:hypothetical protein